MTDGTQDSEDAQPSRTPGLVKQVWAWTVEAWQTTSSRVSDNLATFVAERQVLVWALAITIGVAVAYAATLFRLLLGAIQWLWLGTSSETMLIAAAEQYWFIVLLAPAVGELIVGFILERIMPGRRALGVADVIEARALGDCKITTRNGLWERVDGDDLAWVWRLLPGREGPVVHLGATIGVLGRGSVFTLSSTVRRTLLACGVAAAVSASFNAPIAGVLFAHEVILAHYALRAFVPIVMASVSGAIISRLHYGNYSSLRCAGVPNLDVPGSFQRSHCLALRVPLLRYCSSCRS